jgi:RHS repeat-associated protein
VRTDDGVISKTHLVYDNLGLPIEIGGVVVEWDLTTGWPVAARIGNSSYEWTDEGLVVRRHGAEPEPVALDWARNAEDGLDPWGAGPGRGVRLGYRGELAIGGLVFLRARFYDPATRSFLSPDPLPNPPGAPCGANPYHYAWNDPVSFVDPSGMRPLTQEEFERRKHLEEIGHAGQVVDAMARDPWGAVAMGLVVAAGVGLCFMTGGLALGAGMLIGTGISAGIGAATGNFNPRMVALNGLVTGWTAGAIGALTASDAGVLTRMGTGALAGGVGNAITQKVVGSRFNWASMAWSVGLGGAAVGLGPSLGRLEAGERTPVATPWEEVSVSPPSDLLPYDPEWASRQVAGQNWPGATGYATTPGGRTLSVHAAERIILGGPGRSSGVPLGYIDQILDTGSTARYDPFRQSIQVRAPNLPGRPFVVVDSAVGTHIVTVMVPKL